MSIVAAPHIDTIHLVPDAGFRRHIEANENVGLLTGDWGEAARYILAQFNSWT